MTQKKQPELKGKHKKVKQPAQRTPMQAVMVMGPTGKTRMEWRPW